MDESELPEDVVEALYAGRKVDAIKRLRASRRLGLTEAKQAVDRYARDNGLSLKKSVSISGFWLFFLVICLAIAVYLFKRFIA